MYKERHFSKPKFTLAKLGIEAMIMQYLKYNTRKLDMLSFGLGEDNNVINKDHHKDIKFHKEDRVHNKYMKDVGAFVSQKVITLYTQNVLKK